MGKFDYPVTEVFYRITLDGTAQTVGDVTTFGSIYHGLGRVTRDELETHFADVLQEVGIHPTDILDGMYWIVHEDDQGFVESSGYATEAEYRAAMDELENRWAAFDSEHV